MAEFIPSEVFEEAGRRFHEWSNDPALEIRVAGGALAWDPGQKALETFIGIGVESHVLPQVIEAGAQHIGDLGDTYAIAAATGLAIAILAPRAPRWFRRTAGVAAGFAATFVAEVPKLNMLASQVVPHSLLGTADFPGDVPFGLLGPIVWLAVNIYANRPRRERPE